jgi:integrase
MYNHEDFKKPIIRMGTRILRPKEWKALVEACPKIEYKTILQALLFTGMRYIEMQRFQKYPSWFDGDFVHLPQEASRKKLRTQRERWVRLNNQGKMVVQYFNQIKTPMPSYQSWNENLACWASRAGFPEAEIKERVNKITGEVKKVHVCPGLSVKTTRKTWESWLMFYYPPQIAMITLSQGHTQITSLQHYVNMPFTESDRIEIRNYVEGWI